ncbi:calmodulin-like protein [Achlya hypogyna]|uniref:Calmodulin n=1 Tax=Achlya hypogyna TaxID=1202772 RepID=A0A1V9YDR0_ACHHY|nr:calmodulin-like protein [Achlya hypogyna]
MTQELTETEIAEFREIFNLVDRDRGGSITKVELGELMDTLGINTSPEEIDLMINEIDQDSNGEIDFDEFVAVMSRKVNATYSADQVKASFRMFENASTPGFIRVDRLRQALTLYGSDKITEEQAHELISQLEPDSNGLINYEEYVNMMMSK